MKEMITIENHLIKILPTLEELLKHVETFNGIKGIKILNALNKTKETLFTHAEGLNSKNSEEVLGLLVVGLEEMTKEQEAEIPPEASLERIYMSKENPEFFEKLTTLIADVYFLQNFLKAHEETTLTNS